MAIVNSLRLSRSPSMVRFTMWVRNRVSRAEETKPGLFTTRASCSRTALAGTGSRAGSAGDSWADTRPILTNHTLPCAGLRHVTKPRNLARSKVAMVPSFPMSGSLWQLTAAYGNSGAYWASLDSSAPDVDAERATNKHHHVCERKKTGSDNRAGFATTRSQSGLGEQHQGG